MESPENIIAGLLKLVEVKRASGHVNELYCSRCGGSAVHRRRIHEKCPCICHPARAFLAEAAEDVEPVVPEPEPEPVVEEEPLVLDDEAAEEPPADAEDELL